MSAANCSLCRARGEMDCPEHGVSASLKRQDDFYRRWNALERCGARLEMEGREPSAMSTAELEMEARR